MHSSAWKSAIINRNFDTIKTIFLTLFSDRKYKVIPMQTQRGGGGSIGPTTSQPGTRKMCVVSTKLRPLYPRKKPGTHWTRGCVGHGAGLDDTENLPPPRLEHRTVQPVARRYIDYAIPAAFQMTFLTKCHYILLTFHLTFILTNTFLIVSKTAYISHVIISINIYFLQLNLMDFINSVGDYILQPQK
jgi:hypothetical protein